MTASIYSGMLDEFGILAYKQKNPNTLQFLQTRFTDGMAQVSQTLTDYGRQWYDRAAETVTNVTDSSAMRYARSVLQKVRNVFQRNEIRDLWSTADVQQAPLIMQRYIMAQPDIRKLFHDQRCDGYSETYVDVQPGVIGMEHYDYRRVINNVVMDDPEYDFHISHIIEETLMPEDRELYPDEKFEVLSAWALVKGALGVTGGDDPTSTTGGKL